MGRGSAERSGALHLALLLIVNDHPIQLTATRETIMPPAHRKGDIGSGHECHFPPTPATGGSPNVFVNGKPLMRVGDSYAPHGCVVGHAPPHGRALAEGSASVFVNGQPAGRIGDAIDCGGNAEAGSGDVFIGDRGPKATSDKADCQRDMAGESAPLVRG